MSLTQADHVFLGVHEDGVNDFLEALCSARPRLLTYASDPFVSSTTVDVTHMAAIPFPGVAGGLGWAVSFSRPEIDFFPQTNGLPPELPGIAPGGLSVSTKVTLIVNCAECQKGDRGTDRDRDPNNKDQPPARDVPRCKAEPTEVTLGVFALGRPTATYFGPGTGEIGFRLEAVELVDVLPDGLESLLECLIRMVLQSVLDTVRLPFHALSAGAFSLALTRGPEIGDDQLKAWGTV
ncbi:MAG TPA: hypothetical protein VGM94_01995 [Galbitalea sp.]